MEKFRSDPQAPTMSDAMKDINGYHEYLWGKVEPLLGRRILEIGVGYGQYTRKMIADGRHVLGCDLDENHIDDLRKSISSDLLELLRLDLNSPAECSDRCLKFCPDTIVLLNVLEHIEKDVDALRFLRSISPDGARLILVSPAISCIYNKLDAEAGHYRRYTREIAVDKLKSAGWSMVQNYYFNAIGVLGWMIAGLVNRVSRPDNNLNSPSTNWLLRFYDRNLINISKFTDPLIKNFAGLSLLTIGVSGNK